MHHLTPFSRSQPHPTITFLLVCFLLFLNHGQVAAQSEDVDCVPGQFRQRDRCLTCPRNTYSSIVNATRCENCPDGLVTERGSTARQQCTVCPPGRFLDNTFLRPYCSYCPVDTFNNMRNGTCQPCPPDTASPRRSVLPSDCVSCPRSSRLEVKFSSHIRRCVNCGDGRAVDSINSMTCSVCPAGTFRAKSFPECTECPPGTFSTPGSIDCEPCPMGSFQDLPGQGSCKTCPAGSVTGQGRAACRVMCNGVPGNPSCPDKFCPPGKEMTNDGKGCRNCPVGKINPFNSTTPCAMCGDEDTIVNSERTRCVCEDGFGIGARGQCVECPLGTMSDGDGSRCECILNGVTGPRCVCPLLSRQIGDVCVPCDPASTPGCNERCPSGQTLNRSAGVCEECPANTSSFGGDICKPCEGNQMAEAGSSSCSCMAGTGRLFRGPLRCVPCRPGSFNSSNRRSRCRLCPIGTFSNESGAVRCKVCAEGRVSSLIGRTECLNRCPPNSTRSLSLRRGTDGCFCDDGFRNVGDRPEVICVRDRE